MNITRPLITKRRLRKKTLLASLSIFGISTIIILVYAAVLYPHTQSKPRRFDSLTWLNANLSERGEMVGDLIEQNVLIGLTQEEVQHLLGPPDGSLQKSDLYTLDTGTTFMGSPWHGMLYVTYSNPNKKTVESVTIEQ